MSLNLQNINQSIYFEFYLNDNFFYRYNYNTEELEVSLFGLCKQIGKEILKCYKYKKFTGFNYAFQTSLWFSVLTNCKHENMDIDQTEDVSAKYPLDIRLDEKSFIINLYINLLLLLCDYFDTDSYCEELGKWRRQLQRHSENFFWNNFPNYGTIFFNQVDNKKKEIKKYIDELDSENKRSKDIVEKIIYKTIEDIDAIQLYNCDVLNCYDLISKFYHKCIRFHKHSKNNFTMEAGKDFLQMAKTKNKAFLYYIEGNFKLLSNEQFLEANKMMALKLFMFQINYPAQQINYPNYLCNKMALMANKKKELIDSLYSLQEQAIKTNGF